MTDLPNNSPRIIVFAKAPLPGFAKTRLIPALGEAGAAALAEKMLLHTLRQCVLSGIEAIELCVAPARDCDYWSTFSVPAGVEMTSQGEGDLGQRLLRAATRTKEDSVMLIGTDCPELTASRLRAAAAALEKSDAVIYPARDGGYVLLGLNRVEAALFEGIAWSTEVVAEQTRERLQVCGMNCEKLESLADIDEPGDLAYLPNEWCSYRSQMRRPCH